MLRPVVTIEMGNEARMTPVRACLAWGGYEPKQQNPGESDMKVMQISRNKQLTPEQWNEFKAALDKFYRSPPEDMTIIADYVAVDQSASFILLEVPSLERLKEINEPFEPFVDSEVIEVRPASA